MAYIQQVVCALLAVGWQGVTADGLSHLLSPEHAANTKHHLWQHTRCEASIHNKVANYESCKLKQKCFCHTAMFNIVQRLTILIKPEQVACLTANVTTYKGMHSTAAAH